MHQASREVRPDNSVEEAARLMRARNVGAVVAVADGSPVGLLTDRDIAVEVVARAREPAAVRVGEVMKKHPTVIREDAGIFDELLMLLGSEMGQIAAGLSADLGRGKL